MNKHLYFYKKNLNTFLRFREYISDMVKMCLLELMVVISFVDFSKKIDYVHFHAKPFNA